MNDPEKIEIRKQYSLWYSGIIQSNEYKIVFVDESNFNLHLVRSMGRSTVGTRANVLIPTIRGPATNLIAALTSEKMVYFELINTSTVKAITFKTYLTNLCKHLYDVKGYKKVYLICDNAPVHRNININEVCAQYGFNYKFLSPYSYMLNPIEESFSKIKNYVKATNIYGTEFSINEMIRAGIETITANDCEGWFRYIQGNVTNCAASLPYHHQ